MKINKLLPYWEVKNIRIYYILAVIRNFWFIAGIWMFYWLKFMDMEQLGIFQAIAYGIALVSEVPIGALVDLMGKKKGIVISNLLSTIGCLVVGFSTNAWMVLIGFVLMHFGWNFFGASGDVLAYQSLKKWGRKQAYDRVLSRANFIAISTSIVGTFLGGYFYKINPRIPYLAWSVGYFISLFFSLSLENVYAGEGRFNLVKYLNQLKQGFVHLMNPGIKYLLAVLLVLRGSMYLYGMGFLKPSIALSFGFGEESQSTIFALAGIFGAIAANMIPEIRKKLSDVKGLYLIALVAGLAFGLSTLPLGKLGIIVIMILSICGSLAYPWVVIIVNREVPGRYKGTALSSINLLVKLPYVLTASSLGKIIEMGGLSKVTTIMWILPMIVVLISSVLYNKFRKENKYNLRYVWKYLFVKN